MVVHYTLQGSGNSGPSRKDPKECCTHTEQACEPDNTITGNWWAAQVASNKEYETKREILRVCGLKDEEVFIPRKWVYDVVKEGLVKKTVIVLPGYLLLRLGNHKVLKGISNLTSYISIIGRVTGDEMEMIRDHENIPKETKAISGDKIIITRGPFAGVKGTLVRKHDNGLNECKLIFQGNEIVVDMNGGIVEKMT